MTDLLKKPLDPPGEYPRTVVSELVTETNELTAYVISLLKIVTQDTDKILQEIAITTDKLEKATEDLEQTKVETMSSISSALTDMNNIYSEFRKESQLIKDDLSKVSVEVENIHTNVAVMNNKTEALNITITKLEDVTTSLDNGIDALDLKLRSLSNTTADIDGRLLEMRKILTQMNLDVESNTVEVKSMKAVLESMKSDIDSVTAKVNAAADTVDALTIDISKVTETANNALAVASSASATVNELSSKVLELDTSIHNIETTGAQLLATLNTYEPRITSIDASIQELTTQVADVEAHARDTLQELSGSIQSIRTETADLAAAVTPLASKITDLQSHATRVDAEFTELSTNISNKIIEANATLAEASSAARILQDASERLTNKYQDYSVKAEQASADMATLSGKVTQYNADVEAKKAEAIESFNTSVQFINTMQSDVIKLHAEVTTMHAEVLAAQVHVDAQVVHVDAQVAHVDALVEHVDTMYLRKTERAADTTLFEGKALEYFTNDGNIEAKLAAAKLIIAMKADVQAINDLLSSNDATLDSLQEVVNFIKANKDFLDALTIANISGLQAALDAKLGLHATADDTLRWKTARTITYTGDVTGSTTIDGSGNVSTALTVTDDSHSHSNYVTKVTTVNGRALAASIVLTPADIKAMPAIGGRAVQLQADDEILSGGVADTGNVGIRLIAANNMGYLQSGHNSDEDNQRMILTGRSGRDLTYLNFKVKAGVHPTVNEGAMFYMGNLPAWDNVTHKPAQATRWPTYAEVTGKPATYPSSPHTHLWEDITDKPLVFTPDAHTHPWDQVTGKPATFTPSAHNHYNVISQGVLNADDSTIYSGVSMADMGTGYLDSTGNTLILNGAGQTQLTFSWSGVGVPRARLRGRQLSSGAWSGWTEIVTTSYGTAKAAHKWATARTIALTGAVTGSVSMDGSANVSIATTVVPTGHVHDNLALKATQVIAGDGLTGGGNLSANRTLSVNATVVRTSSAQTISGVKTFMDGVKIGAAGPEIKFNTTTGCLEFTFE